MSATAMMLLVGVSEITTSGGASGVVRGIDDEEPICKQTTTLLSVHRGSRAKRHAARQVAERIVSKPEEAAALVKLLGYSLRSVRSAERRTALAQVVRAATHDAGLKALLDRELPELRFLGDQVTE